MLFLISLTAGLISANPETSFVLPGGVEIEMVWIEPGTFVMGLTEAQEEILQSKGLWEDWFEHEHPDHPVTISKGFYLGKYEITQGQWESVMGTRPWFFEPYVEENEDHPAVYISWDDIQEFIGCLNAAEGSVVYRLPTEAEWEYACRAETETLWSFGDDQSVLGDYAWYTGNAWDVGEQYAHEVGTKLSNSWSLHDMHGNVWEWVQDRYGAYTSDAQTDPTGPSTGSSRIMRGGGFITVAQTARSALRGGGDSPDHRYDSVGARLLRQEPRLYGDVTNNSTVTSLDASWTLQHPVGLRTLTGEDSVAANVSGQMGITAYDASLILQYVVGKISIFPVEEGGVPDPLTKSLVSSRGVSVGPVVSRSDGRLAAPVLIDEMAGVVAGELELSLSERPGRITIDATDLTSDYLLVHHVQDGRIRVAFAGAQAGSGSGAMLEIVFDGSDADALNSLWLERVSLNEGMVPVRIGREAETPRAYRLSQNYPNPFNPETMIRYDVAQDGDVRLSIYTLTGQLVRILADRDHPVGTHSVVWDGTDDIGRGMASGLYLCRMEAGDFRAVRKLLLVR